ncbi:ATP-binding cassette domain-containing protein [uncultured Aurantimicrobium sp.]|uniref:branched-chain amino acid ABC transporter ATP-binding protein/permease n=1 Tax=uncultured Aurantimicrobium sp. TaxID=1705357 RepID=UPI002626ED99|nr:ATP-binding cassette domain-containing protein [uncultured Aurantimicrobium sp.]
MSLANRVRLQGSPWKPVLVAVATLIVGLALTAILPDQKWINIVTSVLVASVSLMGLGVVTGSAGMIALCQLTFAAVGAWVVEWLFVNEQLTFFGDFAFVVYILIGGLVAAVGGILVGLPALRLRGVNLAVLTLGIAAAVDLTLLKTGFPAFVAGMRVERPFNLGPSSVASDRGYLAFVIVAVVLISLMVVFLQRSRWGASWKSVAFSERSTASSGTNVRTAKLSAFAVSAFLGGLAGGLFDGQIMQGNAYSFTTINSLGMYVLSVVAGSYLIDMAIFGGILFILIPEILKVFKIDLQWGNVVFGILGIQALTTNSNLGQDIRNAIYKRKMSKVPPVELNLAPVEEKKVVEVPQGTGRTILKVRDLGVAFGAVKALQNVNLDIEEGTIVGLIGPNGAGKSTFVDALTGFLPHHTGVLTLEDIELDKLSPSRIARVGLRRTYQQDRVPDTLTVGAYVYFVSRGKATPEEIADTLEFFGCPDPTVPLRSVDVGTRRLIEVAANVAAKPKVLLLDEPAAGLSHDEHIAFGERLRSLPSKYGVTVIIIEHDLDLVRSVCTSITVLNFGEVLASGSQEDVLSNPEVLKAYMGETELL